MNGKLEKSARLTILAGLLSQGHARVLIGLEPDDSTYVQPQYLAQLLHFSSPLGTAVLYWARSCGIEVATDAPSVKWEEHSFTDPVRQRVDELKKTGVLTDRAFPPLSIEAEELLHAVTSAQTEVSVSTVASNDDPENDGGSAHGM